jgi:D-inositol-3-phosphate glycosyltransferase
MKKRVALITHELSVVGGLPTMLGFLYRTLLQSGRYMPELISLPTSASDTASLRLTSPATWWARPRIEQVVREDLVIRHVGAWGSELEFQRYRPRRMLSELLRGYDLLQFVVGSPPWVCAAAHTGRPILLWTATTTRADRDSQMRDGPLVRRLWSSMMVPLAERYERRALRIADSVFALSEYTQKSVASIAGLTDVTLAPCGVDTDRFKPSAGALGNYILCVARLSDPRKNVRLLFEAYALLQKHAESTPDLYLVGDPPSPEAQSQLQSLGIADKVRLLGPKQGEELARLYCEALFFVLSSNEEGLGIVILEAMASGLPVVSTACGGPATAVSEGESGFLTPPGDTTALARAMGTLVRETSLRERMGKEGRRVAAERFSFSAAGKVFLEKYDELLSSKPGALRSENVPDNRLEPLKATSS